MATQLKYLLIICMALMATATYAGARDRGTILTVRNATAWKVSAGEKIPIAFTVDQSTPTNALPGLNAPISCHVVGRAFLRSGIRVDIEPDVEIICGQDTHKHVTVVLVGEDGKRGAHADCVDASMRDGKMYCAKAEMAKGRKLEILLIGNDDASRRLLSTTTSAP